ncbi:NADP-dependent oxidoreductase domain protein [Solidesulfovibrio carbinoliphilus subsp. oakridgensis]|uniref:NADP-dependent oxidoreductase domain protein n=1 Tax=Solidesulfovibrio carbinoliphilus subsp. oakridgensis TaxID=694327 RepID=G7Q8D7_9BACT|nr:aldo/keto reductase [Solidesulfovibrio carbinoliphilus]EHJ48549.1 NADP-dependent oxidoreductase domain protein [Solidesulfovibrio carbinoliphilus subsp. oakridgensis]
MGIDRRTFLGLSVAGLATCLAAGEGLGAAAAPPAAAPAEPPAPQAQAPLPGATRKGDMPYRPLGRTGETVSLVGMGGYHLGRPSEKEAIALVRRAVDAGLTFMDNCWDYNGGASEIRMGKALGDGYRDKVFLMTKIDGRDKRTAARQIEESLRRLRTDRIDLLQFHEIIRMDDPDRVFARGGAMEAMAEARQAGKVRFVGFTGHKDPAIHLRMLDLAGQQGVRFDAVQMPLNVMDAHFRSFERQVVPRLVAEQTGVLGMKSMGDSFILQSKVVSPVECLHYAMSLPTSCVITGIDSEAMLKQALDAARTYAPLTPGQRRDLLARTKPLAASGRFELFKTSSRFDGTARNPDWLGPA